MMEKAQSDRRGPDAIELTAEVRHIEPERAVESFTLNVFVSGVVRFTFRICLRKDDAAGCATVWAEQMFSPLVALHKPP
jgi:hypothetical protein